MDSFRAVIEAWPSRSDFAADAQVDYGVSKQWHRRDSIPPAYWTRLVEKAAERNIVGVTLDVLARIAATPKQDAELPDPHSAGADEAAA